MAAPDTTKPQILNLFSKFPPEIRTKIWYEAYASSQRDDALGPGLWIYEPGCWQVRRQADLDQGEIELMNDGFSQGDWDENYGALVYATWKLGTNNTPPSGIARVNHEARIVAKEYCKQQSNAKEDDAEQADDDYDEDEAEEECEDSDMDETEFDEIKPNSGYFYTRKDCLYVPTEDWDDCTAETREALNRLPNGPQCGLDTLWRVAVTPNALPLHLGSLALFMNSTSIVKELQIIFGRPPNKFMEGDVWWAYEYVGKSKFEWKFDRETEKGRFEYHPNGSSHVTDDEFRIFVESVESDLAERLGLQRHQKFRIRPVVAIQASWI